MPLIEDLEKYESTLIELRSLTDSPARIAEINNILGSFSSDLHSLKKGRECSDQDKEEIIEAANKARERMEELIADPNAAGKSGLIWDALDDSEKS